jgi:hypothetical protein
MSYVNAIQVGSYNRKTVLNSDVICRGFVVARSNLRYMSIVRKENLRDREMSGRRVMLGRMYVLAGALCASSCALAASPSIIGSVTVRGETKIDNHDVQGSGTVFDGSVVETGQSISSSADLRLEKNGEITLLRDSRGVLYRDHFVLERGAAQLGLTDSFKIQASGVVVVPTEANSSGIVSIDQANSVTVDAKNGTLEIRNSSGAGLARVRPGHPLAFSSVAGKSSSDFSATGRVSSENGRYYLDSAETGMKYEVKGEGLQSYNGHSVLASGVLQPAASGAGVAGVLVASDIRSPKAYTFPGESTQTKLMIRGFSISHSATAEATRVCPPDPLEDCCPGIPSPQCCNPLPSNECGHSP